MCTLYRPQRHQEDTKTRRKRTDRLPYQSHDHRPHGYEIPDTWYSVYLNVRATTTTKNNPTPLPGTVYYINTNNNQNRNHNLNNITTTHQYTTAAATFMVRFTALGPVIVVTQGGIALSAEYTHTRDPDNERFTQRHGLPWHTISCSHDMTAVPSWCRLASRLNNHKAQRCRGYQTCSLSTLDCRGAACSRSRPRIRLLGACFVLKCATNIIMPGPRSLHD